MADRSVGWCSRPLPWSSADLPESPAAELLPDPAIERLLALCAGGSAQLTAEEDADASQSSSASEEILSNQDLTLDKAVIARDLLGECEPMASSSAAEPAPKRPCLAPCEPELQLPAESPSLLYTAGRSWLEEADGGVAWRKPVQVGPEHQVQLPTGRRRRRPAPARPSADHLLWQPGPLSDAQVERYQRRLRPVRPAAAGRPDDEQALYELQQCGHDVDEALRRVQPTPVRSATDRLAFWSDDECYLFEEGLHFYGKDFHTIQRQKVRTRSVTEIVHFYYLWKKTERHRRFLSRSQLDKRKFNPETNVTELQASVAAPCLQIMMAAEPWCVDVGWTDEPTEPRPPGVISNCPQLMLP